MMEENTRKLPVRFNLDKPDQKRAWEYLQTMDRSVFTSWNHVIHLALLDYFDRYYRIQEDPYLETREREERFVQQIVDAVCESLRQTLPLFLAGSPVALKMMSRYVGQDAAKYAPAAGKIVRELRRYVRRNGHFTLVDIESSDGTCLRITV